jgi:hypothetical protein
MSGINRDLEPDIRHIAKHLPDTPQMQRLLQQEGSAHVFNNPETLQTVAQAIIDDLRSVEDHRGEFIGNIRGHERYGLYFPEPIGYRIDIEGRRLPLYYGEIKIKGDRYHVIPRTRPSR